jgi:anaerobic glycerol-3-phosphate dehydrogenase
LAGLQRGLRLISKGSYMILVLQAQDSKPLRNSSASIKLAVIYPSKRKYLGNAIVNISEIHEIAEQEKNQ